MRSHTGVALNWGIIMTRRAVVAMLALIALLIVVALPAVAADPPVAPPGQANKPDKVAKEPITLSGTIATATDAGGRASFTLRSGGTTYTLDGGPAWFYGDKHPLKAYVGKSVRVVGERVAGATDVDVVTVDGKPLRAAGRPPWAGGWKVVGEGHPGWSQEKADRFKAKFGDCFPPGQCKEKPNKPAASSAP
ncbi:MAG TPA: hypothetical protein VFO73_06555 [Candidatus Limnocylindrales bacterium]|nr:hypothetical protein [Candidatus Limnocylindrales bacterium]